MKVRSLGAAFELGDGVTVEPGAHHFTELWFNFQAPPGPLLRTDIDARIGGFYDGWRFRLLAEPTWNRFPDRDAALDVPVARLRLGAAVNARFSGITSVKAAISGWCTTRDSIPSGTPSPPASRAARCPTPASCG